MDPFAKVELGNTGVTVPRLGLGTAPLSGATLGDGLYGGTCVLEMQTQHVGPVADRTPE